MKSSSARTTAILGILLLSLSGSMAADPYFEELFETSTPNPNFEGQEDFTIAGGSIGPAAPGVEDERRYLRTVVSDYVLRDWVYEVTFKVGDPRRADIAFIGFGHGDAYSATRANEPVKSLHFRVHSPNIGDGAYHIVIEGREGVFQGNVTTYGPHKARITKQGSRVTFEFDADFNGMFAPDSTYTIDDLPAMAQFLELADTHLFLGGVWPQTRFYGFRVTHPFVARTIQFEENGNTASALVTLKVDADHQGPYTLREEFDAGWSVSDISENGTYADGLVWYDASASVLSYRLSRTGAYFSHQAIIAGSLEIQGSSYFIGGDSMIPGGVAPYVPEVLLTPSFRMPAGLDGCSVLPADINAPWIGSCLGPSDATLRPAEGLSWRPTFSSEWSRAAGLDEGLSIATRSRFWTDPDHPQRSGAVLARVQTDAKGLFNWQGANAFNVNLSDTMCVAYFYAINPEAEPKRFNIGMGSDDSSGIRVNGEPVATVIGCGGPQCFAGKYQFILRPGKNLVAFYTFEDSGEYNACIRFEDDKRRPTPVRTTLDPTGYADDAPPIAQDCNGNCIVDSSDIASGFSLDADGNSIPDECASAEKPFRRGDANGDDRFDISDPISVLTCLFLNGPCSPCKDAADANDDGRIDISDAAYLLNWRFLAGPSPPWPYEECGFDVTADLLRGCTFSDC